MSIKDIDGSQPKEFTTKYLGDRMSTQDIEGSKPKEFTEKYLGDRMNVQDIEGSGVKKKAERKDLHDQEFKDVATKKQGLKRENPHDPQEPTYKIRDEKGNLVDYGQVEGSKPTQPYFRKNADEITANSVKGIAYATADTKSKGNFKDRERR